MRGGRNTSHNLRSSIIDERNALHNLYSHHNNWWEEGGTHLIIFVPPLLMTATHNTIFNFPLLVQRVKNSQSLFLNCWWKEGRKTWHNICSFTIDGKRGRGMTHHTISISPILTEWEKERITQYYFSTIDEKGEEHITISLFLLYWWKERIPPSYSSNNDGMMEGKH